MKKGFTLIELLAVIVILAVVSLIAIPIIMNVIETSKKGAIKDSAYGLISASEAYVANNLKHGLESNTKFTCSKNKCVSDDNKEITFKGKVESGTLIISTNNKVLVCVDDGEYYALKLEQDEKVTNGEGTCGAYEESNGTFEIISDIDALKTKYEEEIKQLKEDYDAEIADLREEASKSKKVLIGSYTGNASINISAYPGATVNDFIVEVTSWTSWAATYGTDTSTWTVKAGNNSGSLTKKISGTTLSISGASLAGYVYLQYGSYDLRYNHSATISYKVYYSP